MTKVEKCYTFETWKSDPNLLFKAYLRYLHPETETAIMKSTFQKLVQRKGEPMTKFIGRIHEFAGKAYGDNKVIKEDASCTRLIEGVRDSRIKFKLMEKGTCPLDELVGEAIKYDKMFNSLERRTTPEECEENDILAVGRPHQLNIENPSAPKQAPLELRPR